MADNNVTNKIAESLNDIFLAGVGALSIGGEKAKSLVDDLIEKGQLSVEQGKSINEQLKHKTVAPASKFHEDTVRAYAKTLSDDDRQSFAEKLKSLADELSKPADETDSANAQQDADAE